MKKKFTALLLAVTCFSMIFGNTVLVFGLTAADHIVGNETPPAEAWVSDFTVGLVSPDGSSYVEPTNDYFTGIDRFYFVTGSPAYESLHGSTTTVVRDSGVYNATVIYTPRETFTQVARPVGTTEQTITIADVSPLPTRYFSRLNAAQNGGVSAAERRANATFFFDAGKFIDMDYLDNNNLSGNNTSIVGLHQNGNGESLTTIYRRPIPIGPASNGDVGGRMMRWRFNTPNNYIENIIFDGLSVNMRTPNGFGSGNDRGAYFWVVGIGSDNFVARDVILQNIGGQNTSVSHGGIFAGVAGNQRNVALNVLRTSDTSAIQPTMGPRNFENLTIRNVMTTAGFAVVQFNAVNNTYFRNLNIINPNAAGTATAQNAGAYPIKIEHVVADFGTWLGGDVSSQRNIVFDGELLVPNRGTLFDGIYVQDYRYRNILLPANFSWVLARNANGNDSNFALRVYNRKVSPIANNAALQLDTGYWFVEAAITNPALQAQLNTVQAVINAATPMTVYTPGPNIKMVANNAGQLPGFTIPAFTTPANIVALMQTETPAATLHPAMAHASGGAGTEFVPYVGGIGGIIFPANAAFEHQIFNFNFRTPTPDWTIEDAEDGNIVNFTRVNSGRNLFVRYIAMVSYTVTGDAPVNFTPAIPGDTPREPGTAVAIADGLTSAETSHNGVPGTWVFNGWTTEDLDESDITDGEFTMPSRDVAFVGTWTFTPASTTEFAVNYAVSGDVPASFTPQIPGSELFEPGETVTVADGLTTTETSHNGVPGTWVFNGWATADAEVTADNTFTMPANNVIFTGTWIFTPDVQGEKPVVNYTVSGPSPATFFPSLPAPELTTPGSFMVVLADLVTAENSHNGILGTWVFNGWVTTDACVENGTFIMPYNNVVFVGTWRFIPNVYIPYTPQLPPAPPILPQPPVTPPQPVPQAPSVYIPWAPREVYRPEVTEVIYADYETIYFVYDEKPVLTPVDPAPIAETHFAYMIGYREDGTIRPNANITRAEVATIFFRLITDEHRANIWSQTNSFKDVQLERWFNNAVSTMENGGLFAGIPLGTNFNPNQAATRAEFAAMVVNYLGLGHYRINGGNAFTDIEGHWASDAINVAYLQGWINGFGDGTFRPDELITRAQVAALINRALGRLPEHPGDLLEDMVRWPDNMNENAWYFLYIQEASNSHYHVKKEDGIHETWTRLIQPRNWRLLERPYSIPTSIIRG